MATATGATGAQDQIDGYRLEVGVQRPPLIHTFSCLFLLKKERRSTVGTKKISVFSSGPLSPLLLFLCPPS